MYKVTFALIIMLIILSSCNGSGRLDTAELQEKKLEHESDSTVYEAEATETAREAVPYPLEFPAYIPFEHAKTNVFITDWKNSKKNVVAWRIFHSAEKGVEWDKSSFAPQPVPYVHYSVSNFDMNYTTTSDSDLITKEEIQIKEGVTGLFLPNEEMGSAQLTWFKDGMEQTIGLNNFSNDKEELKTELIKIANSI